MREALARSDLDFVVTGSDESRRGYEPARFPKILRVASIATACVVCAVIVVNALFLQDRKHPAPLLRAPDPVEAVPALAPAPVQRPAALGTPAPSASVKNSGRDQIADEIGRMTSAPDRKVAKPASTKPDDDRSDPIANLIGTTPQVNASVMAAQKALVRLGYVLRADGVVGTTTHQAIERYERDNKLPVRGELTPKLSRELMAKAGASAQ